MKKSSLNIAEALLTGLSAIAVRSDIAARLGKQFSNDRDLYEALGYKKRPTFKDYMAKYKRQDVARAVVDRPVEESWRILPRITESTKKETKFEKEWEALVKKRRVFYHLSRVDKMAGIGSYAILLLGFDDGGELNTPVTRAKQLLYLMPYDQSNAKIKEYEGDTKNERYGLPKLYELQMKKASGTGTQSKEVHYSRVIHVAEDLLENDVEGMPRLQAILNRLDDLERIVGGSGEMWWRGAFPGLGFKVQSGAQIGKQGLSDLEDEIEDYTHGLKRYLRLQGIDIQELRPQVADPSQHVAIQIDMIAAARGIPKRILLGSERGELASSQDERSWAKKIGARQSNYCEPVLLRPLIDTLIEVGILSTPTEGYTIQWADLAAPTKKEIVGIGESLAKALKAYVEALGADQILPSEMFLRELGFSEEKLREIDAILDGIRKGEED